MQDQGVLGDCKSCDYHGRLSKDGHCQECIESAKVATCKIRGPKCAESGKYSFFANHPEYEEKPKHFKFNCAECLALLSCKICTVNVDLLICTRCVQNGVYCTECANTTVPPPLKWYCPACTCKHPKCKSVSTQNCSNGTCGKHCKKSACRAHSNKEKRLVLADATVHLIKSEKRLRKLDETRGDVQADYHTAMLEFKKAVQDNLPLEECDRALKKAMITEKHLNVLPVLEKQLNEEKTKWKHEQEEIYNKIMTDSQ